MLQALLLVLDQDLEHPLHSEPEIEELEDEHIARLSIILEEVAEGERRSEGTEVLDDVVLGYRVLTRFGLAFCGIADDGITAAQLMEYLTDLVKAYTDEVDDLRNPDREGIGDVILDVIAPWED